MLQIAGALKHKCKEDTVTQDGCLGRSERQAPRFGVAVTPVSEEG